MRKDIFFWIFYIWFIYKVVLSRQGASEQFWVGIQGNTEHCTEKVCLLIFKEKIIISVCDGNFSWQTKYDAMSRQNFQFFANIMCQFKNLIHHSKIAEITEYYYWTPIIRKFGDSSVFIASSNWKEKYRTYEEHRKTKLRFLKNHDASQPDELLCIEQTLICNSILWILVATEFWRLIAWCCFQTSHIKYLSIQNL